MMRIHVFCEGQTEESFVRQCLAPHFEELSCWLNPIVVRTGPHGKGGSSSYEKIRRQILQKCKEDPTAFVTTMLDVYGLPKDFPGRQTPPPPPLNRARFLMQCFQEDIFQPNFLANLTVHEFEALLFSKPEIFSNWFDAPIAGELCAIRSRYPTPEDINQSPDTAPSKRILALCPTYQKKAYGTLIALDIGLATIRKNCPHFDSWLRQLEQIALGEHHESA